MRITIRRTVVGFVLAACAAGALVATASLPASADEHWWHDDIHHFHEHDVDIWRHGRWFHGVHEGRPGWWWIVGGVWYFYPRPVYPYPDPYVPPVAVPPPTYYWCANPPGYYPQVAACRVPWQAVPATAAAPPLAVAPAPAPAPVPQPPPPSAAPAPQNAPPPAPSGQ